MLFYQVTGTAVFHTTDAHCVSTEVLHAIPAFLLDAAELSITGETQALDLAYKIVCPMAQDLQYESVTLNLGVARVYRD